MSPRGAAKKRASSAEDDAVVIPDKLYFRIGEVSELLTLPSYVLRFWETEFPQLKPSKSSTGQRLYRRKDLELLLRIKRLLYSEGYTIAGARQFMKDDAGRARSQPTLFASGPAMNGNRAHELKRIKKELEGVATLLRRSGREK